LKKFVKALFAIQLAMLISASVTAQFQPTMVTRSQEKTIVDGKIYYIHTVLKGQTAYSISKAYEVTLDEIRIANPGIDILQLSEGLAIRIPDSKLRQAVAYPQNKEDFIAHVVKRKDTVYSIAKKYRIDEALIYQFNPWAREGIKPDQTLWIPHDKSLPASISEQPASDQYYFYTVKEKDTLYSIAKSYGVDMDLLIQTNPDLRYGLKPGQVLKIRKQAATPEEAESDTLPLISGACQPPSQPPVYNIALMLPLYAGFNYEELVTPDSMIEEGTYVPQQRQQGLRGRNFAEFYEGFLLALDSLKRSGLSVNLRVYDTERDTLRVKKFLKDIAPVHPDLIIGPVFTEDVRISGRLAMFQDFQLISPLSTRAALVNNNPNLVQVIPPRQAESYAMANYLKQFKKGRIILLRGMDSTSMSNSWRFKKYITENMPVDESGKPLHFHDYRLNDSLFNALGKVLSKEEENLVVVFSDNEAMVSILVSRLIQRSSTFPVVLFGMPSWQSWTNIDLTFFHSLQLHIITPFYTDYDSPAVKRFINKSRSLYGYEPFEISPLGYSFSMLGYDIGSYFLSALKQYGRNFATCINDVSADKLLSEYHFGKTAGGGYMNTSFSVLKYENDFTIEKVAVVKGEPVTTEIIIPPVTPNDTIPATLPLP
jgi:LysM repeat protein/ABC-type branched-subunit amino acid transport system substrate-binding protein